MKTKEEAIQVLSELCKDTRYPGSSSLCDFKVEIENAKAGREGEYPAYRITISQMYEAPIPAQFDGNILAFYKAVEAAVGANNLSLSEEIERRGCETCDHGSEYGWEFLAWETPSNENSLNAPAVTA
jgi:hypothetical protein